MKFFAVLLALAALGLFFLKKHYFIILLFLELFILILF